MKTNNLDDSELVEQLKRLRGVPQRRPENASHGKAAFLQAARQFAPTVSSSWFSRPINWMQKTLSKIYSTNQERRLMFGPIAIILMIAALLFGGGGVTVAAAQSAQPDDALYAVKLASEDVRMQLTLDPKSQADLVLSLAQRRAQEIQSMVTAGEVPPEEVQTRYQAEVEQAVQIAAGLPTDNAVQALEKIQERLRTQQQDLTQLDKFKNDHAREMVLRARLMVESHLKDVQAALMDPAKFQKRTEQNGDQTGKPTEISTDETATQEVSPSVSPTVETTTPEASPTYVRGNGNCAYCSPTKPGNGGNPWILGTPVPGEGPKSACGINFPPSIRRTDCPSPWLTPHPNKPNKNK